MQKLILIIASALLSFVVVHASAEAKKGARAHFPSMQEAATFWKDAGVVFDRSIPDSKLRVVCSLLPTLGMDCYLGIRVTDGEKIRQEVYFISDDWSSPTLVDGEKFARVVEPSGDELLVVPK